MAIDSVEMVRRLVGFDTTSRGSNLALIEFVRSYLDSHGVPSELVFDETGNKANLYATLGVPGIGGIMLSGHTDVVPVDGQDWHSDPFTVLARGRQAVRPRHGGHEELYRGGAGIGAEPRGALVADTAPPGLVL